jgi:hypothetical protein
MSTKAQHHAQWQHNRGFIKSIDEKYCDWVVTAMFYTAVHAVQLLLEHDNVRGVIGHTGRNQILKKVSRYREIWNNYRPLFDAARASRYDCAPGWIPIEDVKRQLAPYLYRLETSVTRLSGVSVSMPKLW